MSQSHWIRRTHRWVAMAFTVLVITVSAAYSFAGQPPMWLVLAPLPPLFLLMFSGLYLFFRPEAVRRRGLALESDA